MIKLKDFKPRLYQQTIFASALSKNTLVVLPTGLGKTAIAMMLSIKRLNDFPKSKVVLLAPTKPLVEQHYETFKKYTTIDPEQMVVFTGSTRPDKRAALWNRVRVVFSTPQGFENDVISDKLNIRDVSLMIFDEAHRAVGNYSYVFIARHYDERANFPRILALTASPGSDVEKIREVCKNLFIENVEVRTVDDFDVKPYVKETLVDWKRIELPAEFKQIRDLLRTSYREKIDMIKKTAHVDISNSITKKGLLELQLELRRELNQNKDYSIMRALSLLAQAVKVQHAIELIETQGVFALKKYFNRFVEEAKNTKVKAVKNLMKDHNFTAAISQTNLLYKEGVEHPKIPVLIDIIKKDINKKPDSKIIVFTQYRDSASKIIERLIEQGIKAKIFVGQQKKLGTGLSQKEQKSILNDFRNNAFNVLVSTSVGEEGLDIPQVDRVVFYEPIPSAIRQIQRRGRTGRQEKGFVSVLYTKGTRDEGYMWVAIHKEKRMKRILLQLKREITLDLNLNKTLNTSYKKDRNLSDFLKKNEILIIADYREKSSRIFKLLLEKGVKVDLKRLDIGDYILSQRVAVELKTKKDFVDSIIDGRLLSQVKELKENYERPIILVEGSSDIYSERNIHKNAVNGMIITLIINYGVPILWSKNAVETADLFYLIAKKEQLGNENHYELHSRKPLTLKEQQEYVVSSLPGVGLSTARDLLKKFGSVRNIVSSAEDKLKEVSLIGKKKARKIRDVIDSEYKAGIEEGNKEDKEIKNNEPSGIR